MWLGLCGFIVLYFVKRFDWLILVEFFCFRFVVFIGDVVFCGCFVVVGCLGVVF